MSAQSLAATRRRSDCRKPLRAELDWNLLRRLLFLFLEAEIAGVAHIFAVDNACVSAVAADLVMVNSRVERLCFLKALAADGGIQVVAGQKAGAALGAL